MNQADVSRLVSKLRIRIAERPRKLKNVDGSEGRLRKLQYIVNGLVKYERMELNYNRADEARGYVERLISEAIRHGDIHKPTMEMASYWLNEKQLVHKLFKVLVPRFKDHQSSYTSLYKAPKLYPEIVFPRSVLELKGNPYPPLVFDDRRNRNLIHNILLDEARKVYRAEKYAQIAAKIQSAENEQKDSTTTDTSASTMSEAAREVSEAEQLLKMIQAESEREPVV